MPKADKKQRQKLKREAKKRDTRRRESVGPLKRLADAPGDVECWMSADMETFRQAQIFTFKRGRGICGAAFFLIDRGVVGLKDTWTLIDISYQEFRTYIDKCESAGFRMDRVSLDEVRRRVGGAAKWAHQNGMRLPKDWLKVASVIGGVGDWMSADMSEFAMEFVGHPEDLRRRLIGEPFDTYVQRTDVAFVFSENAPVMDLETGEYENVKNPFGGEDDDEDDFDDEDNEEIDEDDAENIPDISPVFAEQIAILTRRCFPTTLALASQSVQCLKAKGETPSTELVEAWTTAMVASMLAKTSKPDAPDEEVQKLVHSFLMTLAKRLGPSRTAEHRRAINQTLGQIAEDPQIMRKAIDKYGILDAED